MTQAVKKIGKYNIQGVLGEGAMGVVYDAFDPDIERRVAIKAVHAHLVRHAENDEFLVRFKREAQAAAKCMHPNIVMIMEYGEENNAPYMVMEFVEGVPLNRLLKSDRKFSLDNVLSIVSQTLKALNLAHSKNVVHRDIKPANILIQNNGTVKLADFGIARVPSNSELTEIGVILGTPRFMAPEQTFGQVADKRADLFAVAMIFVDLLGKIKPSQAIKTANLPQIDGLPPNNKINYNQAIPTAFIETALKGLAPKADDRYQSAREFAQGIKRALELLKAGQSPEPETFIGKPGQTLTVANEDITTLERMLSEHIGPIAKNLVNAQLHNTDSSTNLAESLAQEIPDEGERTQFLKKWADHEDKTAYAQKAAANQAKTATSFSSGPVESTPEATQGFDEHTLNKLRDDFASYVGPMASRLITAQTKRTQSFEYLIQGLAQDIPDKKERDRFINHWC